MMEVTSRAIIITDKGVMSLYREKVSNGERRKYYVVPGGHVEDGEDIEDAVVRELKEELNLDIEIVKLLGCDKYLEKEDYYFLCKVISGEPVLGGEELEKNNPDNYYEFRYLPLDKIDSLWCSKYIRMALDE